MGRDTLEYDDWCDGEPPCRHESTKYIYIENIINRDDNEAVDWLMLLTQLQYEVALGTLAKRDWAIYYMLRAKRDQLKQERNWRRLNHEKVLDR